MNNTQAAATNDRRTALIALRDTLADAIDTAATDNFNMLPQLTGQYRATLEELAEIDTLGKGGKQHDEFSTRRKDRIAKAATGNDAKQAGG